MRLFFWTFVFLLASTAQGMAQNSSSSEGNAWTRPLSQPSGTQQGAKQSVPSVNAAESNTSENRVETQSGDAAPPRLRASKSRSKTDLSEEDQELLARGPYSSAEHVGGALGGLFLGFGIGHAIQGRYAERGWIFTVGTLLSSFIILRGAAECIADAIDEEEECSSRLIDIGLVGLLGFRIWEVVDTIIVPTKRNQRYRYLKSQGYSSRVLLYPIANGRQHGLGLVVRF